MPPALVPSFGKRISDSLELVRRHLGEIVEVHNSPASRLGAADDVAACRLVVSFAVETVATINVPVTAEGRQNLGGGGRAGAGQARHEVQFQLWQLRIRPGGKKLGQDLKRVGAVASATRLQRRCAQLGVLGGKVRDATLRGRVRGMAS